MLESFSKTLLFAFLSMAVSGCVRTTTVGHKVSEVSAPIRKMNYEFENGDFKFQDEKTKFMNKAAQEAVKKTLDALKTSLPKRMPIVFGLNNVEVMSGDKPEQYLLRVMPRYAEYNSAAGADKVSLDLRAMLLDMSQNSKVIWWGDIHVFHNQHSDMDDQAVDNFAKSILEQLVKAEVVWVENAEIKMPQYK
jgi:hypothetical protein